MSRKITDAEIAQLRSRSFGADGSPRGRLLAIAELLRMFTDEDEGLTALEIARVLGECSGKTPTEATVRGDLSALIEARPLGIEIVAPARGENLGFRCVRGALSPNEAVLLSDMVRTCKFINSDQREELCGRLQTFIPESRLADAEAAVYVDERDRGAGPDILDTVRLLSQAIANNQKVCFYYDSHLIDGTRSLDGPHEEDPVALIFSYGHYYLEVCRFSNEHPEGVPFFRRLDHMRNVTIPGRPVDNPECVAQLQCSVVSTAQELVDMMGDGVGRTLFLRVEGPSRAKYVYDRFGHDIHFEHVSDDGKVGYVCVRAQLSPTLFR